MQIPVLSRWPTLHGRGTRPPRQQDHEDRSRLASCLPQLPGERDAASIPDTEVIKTGFQ